MYFSENDIQKLQNALTKVKEDYEEILLKWSLKDYKTEKAYEFAIHGFNRRLKTLSQCIYNIYEICPPENIQKLNSEELCNITINIHAFLINLYGCLDNLARIWVEEKNIKNNDGSELKNKEIGFSKKQKIIWKSFSREFRDYINNFKEWMNYLEDFRHALAHRIPPYIPPYVSSQSEVEAERKLKEARTSALLNHNFDEYEILSLKIDNLGKFAPWVTHSFSEKSKPMVFHAQMISDWNTIVEISNKLYEEL